MKHWLLVVALICFGSSRALAGAFNQTCTRVAISSSSVTPTELTNNVSTNTVTNAGASVWAVKVTNLDTTNDLFCSQDKAVAATGSHMGEQIAHSSAAPWNWLSWLINSSADWYCMNNGGSGTTFAEVCLTQ
jgi:hypothetical protein